MNSGTGAADAGANRKIKGRIGSGGGCTYTEVVVAAARGFAQLCNSRIFTRRKEEGERKLK